MTAQLFEGSDRLTLGDGYIGLFVPQNLIYSLAHCALDIEET